MKNLQFQGISENLKFIFTNRGVVTSSDFFSNSKEMNFIDYSFENLPIALDILKETNEFFYKYKKISLNEYTSAPRKFLYKLIEIFNPQHEISIIKEWEEKFGQKLILINESVEKLLVETRVNESWDGLKSLLREESTWYNPLSWDYKGAAERVGKFYKDSIKKGKDWTVDQIKQVKQKGLGGYIADKAKSVWNSVKDAVSKAYKCLTNNFAECLFENLRAATFSAYGMGVMVGISMIPEVGQVADFIVFGSLLIWDVYKALSGKYESGPYKWSWADIIIDAVCIITPMMGPVLKATMKGISSGAQLAAKAAKGGILGKVFNILTKSIGKIVGIIGRCATWIGEKLGLTWLKEFGTKAQNYMKREVEGLTAASTAQVGKIETKIASTATKPKVNLVKTGTEKLTRARKGLGQFLKDFKFNKPTPVVIKNVGVTVLVTASLCAALGMKDPMKCHNDIEDGKISEEEIKKAQEALKSGEFNKQLNQLSVQDAEKIGLF